MPHRILYFTSLQFLFSFFRFSFCLFFSSFLLHCTFNGCIIALFGPYWSLSFYFHLVFLSSPWAGRQMRSSVAHPDCTHVTNRSLVAAFFHTYLMVKKKKRSAYESKKSRCFAIIVAGSLYFQQCQREFLDRLGLEETDGAPEPKLIGLHSRPPFSDLPTSTEIESNPKRSKKCSLNPELYFLISLFTYLLQCWPLMVGKKIEVQTVAKRSKLSEWPWPSFFYFTPGPGSRGFGR